MFACQNGCSVRVWDIYVIGKNMPVLSDDINDINSNATVISKCVGVKTISAFDRLNFWFLDL